MTKEHYDYILATFPFLTSEEWRRNINYYREDTDSKVVSSELSVDSLGETCMVNAFDVSLFVGIPSREQAEAIIREIQDTEVLFI